MLALITFFLAPLLILPSDAKTPDLATMNKQAKENIEDTIYPAGAPAPEKPRDLTEKEKAHLTRKEKNFLEEAAKGEKVHTLGRTRLLIKVLKKGDGKGLSPEWDDEVFLRYKATLRNGTVALNSGRGAPAKFTLSKIPMKAWRLCLQLMSEGDKWRIWAPHDLAYGIKGLPPKIPQMAPLVFEIEVVKVKGRGKQAKYTRREVEDKTGRKWDEL